MTVTLFSRTDQSALSDWWWTIDRTLLFIITFLAIIGVAMVTTASPAVAERLGYAPFYFLTKHMIFLIGALVIMLFLSFISEQWIWRLSALGFALSIIAMILTVIMGYETKGGQRWLSVVGFNIQPSEFLKPSFLVVSAWIITKAKESKGQTIRRLQLLNLALLFLCLGLLIAQPDFGMSALLVLSFCTQLFLSGFSIRYFILLGGLCVVGLLAAYLTLDHVTSRIDRFINPASGDTYQIDRSMESFANGGLIGAGPGQGTIKMQLPDAHSDFIFSVAGEEFGFLLTLGLIGLYAFMLYHGLKRLMLKDSLFAMLAGGSLLAMIAIQSMIHMGSAMQLIPTKGMTLPFISYGGSSVLAIGYTLGVVLALTRRYKDKGYATF